MIDEATDQCQLNTCDMNRLLMAQLHINVLFPMGNFWNRTFWVGCPSRHSTNCGKTL